MNTGHLGPYEMGWVSTMVFSRKCDEAQRPGRPPVRQPPALQCARLQVEKEVRKDRPPFPSLPPVPEHRVLAAVNPGGEASGSRDRPKVGRRGGHGRGSYDLEVRIGCNGSGMFDSARNFKMFRMLVESPTPPLAADAPMTRICRRRQLEEPVGIDVALISVVNLL